LKDFAKIGKVDKKVLFLTGTRADFGKLKSYMRAIEASPGFECHIFCTGMHTLSRYGSTYDEIRKSGFKNIFLYINQIDNQSSAMDLVLANTIQGLGHYIREFTSDIIVVHGDRVETLAGAIVGALNNIPVAHVEGGELSGAVDELIRHSVSKLAHVHFVANDESKLRLLQMGETDDSIFVVGSPDIDIMLSDKLPTLSEVKRRYGIRFDEYAIFSYHPVTTDVGRVTDNIKNVVDALEASQMNFVVIYPNNDSGSDIILNELSRLKGSRRYRMFPSIRFEYFLTLLKHAKVIVGNSSAGIHEAPVYGVPTINIGNRQQNRFDYPSILNVKETEVLWAMNNLPEHISPSLHFGNGDSAKLFMEILKEPDFWERKCQKQFCDLQPALSLSGNF